MSADDVRLRVPDHHPLVVKAVDGTPIFTVHEDGTWTGTVESLDDLARAVADLLRRPVIQPAATGPDTA